MLRRGTHVQQAQLQMARRAFAAYDVDGDGAVTRSDLKTVFTKLGKPSDGEALDRWIAKHDADRDGTVSLSDFLNALAPIFGDGFTLSDLRRLFDRVDKDRTGFLTPAMVAAA
ncbi:hypothetical protein AURANDRAFT_21046, partial [Aureococcus anophagefferens]